MNTGVYILVRFVILFLDMILLAMLVRAVLSWLPPGDGISRVSAFLFVVTEPFIMPVRAICAHFGWFQGSPLDLSFLITTMILSLTNVLLSGMIP